MSDSYLTIAQACEGLFKDKGSKFLAYAYPVETEDEIKEHIQNLKKEHYSARHHCYAWRLGADKTQFRANDDGEPSSTAGKPILGQIQRLDLTNILVVVVRYFGGTLLGVSGLINAYRAAAADALEQAEIVEQLVEIAFWVEFDYLNMNSVMKVFKDENLPQKKTDFDLRCRIRSSIRESESERLFALLLNIEGVRINQL
ncbi:IMPACT family protein [Mangrovibacterium diazotrophicum]|uniref:Putative YigZ family protein n=1 Tax=Mangrovibacterium diazotrophicum TaxID=1261403 RepID=A0A419W3V8_9BACT|nr:YigZ family protein [Mangrovibacterium diazotrophicum]RKD90133.1 putative YigZ family protein [Mangrovibacterium diazotrophicum]